MCFAEERSAFAFWTGGGGGVDGVGELLEMQGQVVNGLFFWQGTVWLPPYGARIVCVYYSVRWIVCVYSVRSMCF
jgi:hypothetical protein